LFTNTILRSNIVNNTNVHVWPPYHKPVAGVDVEEGVTFVLVDCTVATLEVDATMEVVILGVAVDTIYVSKSVSY